MKQKALSLMLALVLILGLLPVPIRASQDHVNRVIHTMPQPETPASAGAQPQTAYYSVYLSSEGCGTTEMISQDFAAEGEEVYFLADADNGYYSQIYVSGVEADAFRYTGMDVWMFRMPANNVWIDVVYVPLEGEEHTVSVQSTVGGTWALSRTSAKMGESIFLAVMPDEPGSLVRPGGVRCTDDSFYFIREELGVYYYELIMPDEDVSFYIVFGDISRTHPVSVTVDTGLGGTASVDLPEASPSYTVTLTCTPEEGYRVAQITGAPVTDRGDGVYSFLMHDEPVDLHVLFLRSENPFLDVNETQFFYNPVLWALENNITSGISDSAFDPFTGCNRAQVVTFLWRAAGCPEPVSTDSPFTDVESGKWYTKAVLWAVENGITNGLTADTFGPNALCNRAQVVTFLWRAQGRPAPALAENPFTDVPAGSWYEAAVLWAVERNVTTGAYANLFNPTGVCVRAHVVTFLYRASLL